MGTTTRGLEYPDSTSNFTPSSDIQTLAEGVDGLFDGTTGTWTPSVGWTLSGTWSGVYRRIGDLVVAGASITTTAAAAAWPTSDTFSVTGLPLTVTAIVSGTCLVGWGLRPHPVGMSGSSIYVSLVNKTSSLPPSGTIITISVSYLATS